MTVIDRISFRFGMADERFARELYADWDGFCLRCAVDILEAFFARYDTKDTYIEIDLLDLDLGGIPQEEFRESFPVRLREALERSFPPIPSETGARRSAESEAGAGSDSAADDSFSHAREKRFENLLHYLEYGFCRPEWDACGFDLYEELLSYEDSGHAEKLLSMLVSKPYVMERLLLQTDAARLEAIMPFGMWLSSSVVGRYERQRFLSILLEDAPQVVLRFIHKNKDLGNVESMAELLEYPHVRRIMAAETENHAEIDVPEYWYRLYGWLLEYYPFNGVPMFGDKRHFRLHLNRRLLTFIQKRAQPAYLSKADLTVGFLLEVFGAKDYRTVLEIIYRNQQLNADGSPAAGDGYVRELYYILLRLSLISAGPVDPKHAERPPAAGIPDASPPHASPAAVPAGCAGSLRRWLEDAALPDAVKSESLSRLAHERPELLVQWLRDHRERRHLSLLAAWTDERTLLLLAGHTSLQLAKAVSAISDACRKASLSVSWLRNTGADDLMQALNRAVLNGISAGILSASDSAPVQVLRITDLLYKEVTGQTVSAGGSAGKESTAAAGISEPVPADNRAVPKPLREFLDSMASEFPALAFSGNAHEAIYQAPPLSLNAPAAPKGASLKAILSDRHISEEAKRLLVLQWFDACRGEEGALISDLQAEKLLDAVIDSLDKAALRHIARRLAMQGCRMGAPTARTAAVRSVEWVTARMEAVAELVSIAAKDVWRPLLVALGSWNVDAAPASMASSADAANDRSGMPADDTALNEVQTAFERHSDDVAGLLGWLRSERFAAARKREVCCRWMAHSPEEAVRLLRAAIASDESTVGLWAEIIGKDAVLDLIGQTSSAPCGGSMRIIGAMNSAFAENGLFTGSSAEWNLSVTKAILLLMAERPELGDMDAEEAIPLFLRCLHHVLTGNREHTDADREKWEAIERRITYAIAPETAAADTGSGAGSDREDGMPALKGSLFGRDGAGFDEWAAWLISSPVSDAAKAQMLLHYARWHPKLLWAFVRYSAVGGPGKTGIPFGRWNAWLGGNAWLEMISGVSFAWAETLRRTTEALSRKYGVSESALSEGLVRFAAGCPPDRIYYEDSSVIRRYIGILMASVWKDRVPDVTPERLAIAADDGRAKREESENPSQSGERQSAREAVVGAVEAELRTTGIRLLSEEAVQPEYIEVPNAGLCLLAIWFPRLFGMLGLLTEDRKELNDTEARIRAIFILQRLVTDEVRAYREHELAFGRILTECPFHVPLPKTLELTDNEIRTAASMLAGAKANWDKLKNTSVRGFQRSFIERPGRLEQREDKWVLYVESRAYDILLDSLPWPYDPIRLPWLKKKIHVVWRDKTNHAAYDHSTY